jgi:hypothetical protein
MPTIRVFCCAFPQPFCHLGSRMSYLRIKPGPQNISERVAFAQFCVPGACSTGSKSYSNPIAADRQTGRVRRKRARLPSNGSI